MSEWATGRQHWLHTVGSLVIYNRRGNRERRNPEVSFQEAMPEYHGQSQRLSIVMARNFWKEYPRAAADCTTGTFVLGRLFQGIRRLGGLMVAKLVYKILEFGGYPG